MNFEMDLFDWSQLPGQFEHEDISGGLGDVLATDNFAAATLGWTDYFSTPNVSMMTYPEARRMLNERQQSLIQTPALTRNSGSSFSTNESCQCDDGNEGSQKDLADEDKDEDETVAPRSGGRPRTPLHNGRDPVLNRIQRRRTQNRNSQRIYRQRRMEERQRFEERAIAAEEASRQLKVHLTELHTTNARLKHRVQQLEAENEHIRGRNEQRGQVVRRSG